MCYHFGGKSRFCKRRKCCHYGGLLSVCEAGVAEHDLECFRVAVGSVEKSVEIKSSVSCLRLNIDALIDWIAKKLVAESLTVSTLPLGCGAESLCG